MAGEQLERGTLLGKGHAFVAGLPAGFNFNDALLNASAIRMATAFAHRSGWRHVKEAIRQTKGEVSLLTGLDCFQTEPAILRDWRDLALMGNNRIAARLASDKAFFHPKVFVVKTGQMPSEFALVGSGNLSQGGLRDNVECCLYTEDANIIRQISDWFDNQFRAGVPITERAIDSYEIRYGRNRRAVERARRESLRATKDAVSLGRGDLQRLEKAIQPAKDYFKNPKSDLAYRARLDAIHHIRKILHYPMFDFNEQEWKEFYEIGELGQLNRLNRDRLYRSGAKLRRALQLLIGNPEKALSLFLERGSGAYLSGLGVNTVSKILAAYDPKTWPVFNGRVVAALDQFDYRSPRGASPAAKYLAYKQAMAKFMADSGAKDTLALDAFFYDRSKSHEKYRK